LATSTSAQKGPGGVTDDSDDQKNCRLWLNAGDLNLSDQSDVTLWIDRSISGVVDEAFWDSGQDFLPPIFRNDPSNGINGKPVISFEDGGMLSIGSLPADSASTDLNTNPGKKTTYEQSIFLVFRTANDVASRQIIWEEGGYSRGLNIQIYNGEILVGVYDTNVDGELVAGGGDANIDIFSPVPKFGFSYKKLPIQPNTTYVLSMLYDVSTSNTLLNPANSLFTGLSGFLNGVSFPYNLENGCCENPGVGGIYTHPDPIGIGGLNRAYHNELGPVSNFEVPTGSFGFKGRLAEICYYAFTVSPSQRIIIENYLAAKYFASVLGNDKYDYQTGFGDDVIGIGKENNSDFHNVSQGDNLFEISVSNFSAAFPSNEPYYLMVGHNNSPMVWTAQNVPDTLTFQRLRRMWRFDRKGPANGDETLHLEIDSVDLPPLPAGYSAYGILVDNSNGILPNFSSDELQIIGLYLNEAGRYECEVEIIKGSYLTVAAIQPSVEFGISSKSSIEGDDPPISFIESFEVQLNYSPPIGVSYEVNLIAEDGTALEGSDYNWPSSNSPLLFNPGVRSISVDVQILNDNESTGDEAIEEFEIIITSGTGGLSVGSADTIIYKILDNDPPPKLTFESAEYFFNESAGQVKIPLEIIGTFTGNPTAQISIKSLGSTTAGEDFTMATPQLLTFTPFEPRDSVVLDISDDPLDEFDEYFTMEISSANGIGFDDTLNIETQINIVDNDVPPTVNFLASSSEGYEGIGDPRIYVILSAPSSKQIEIPFTALDIGTATNGAIFGNGSDYEAEINSTLVIPAGDTLSFIYYDIPTNETNFIVNSDDIDEPDESAVFELDPDPVNAQIGTLTQHTYFIKDYVEFDNRGVAGVGKERDNTIYMVADAAVNPGNIPNLSPRNIELIQNTSANQPAIENNALNERSVLSFDGIDDILAIGDPSTAGQSSLINTAGFYDGKSIFLVITPENAGSSTPQMIFEQGGKGKGLALYLQNNTLYFQGLNASNDGDYSPWGADLNDLALVASTTSFQNGETYVISVHYLNNLFPNAPDNRGLKIYVNGALEQSYTGDVGRLYTHTGRAALGGIWNNSFTFNGPIETFSGFSNFFEGDIAEMIYFNEPNRTDAVRMNDARINIIHNHLSAKYDVALAPAVQYFDVAGFGDAGDSDYFGHDVAGIAFLGDHIHGDSKGRAEIRVQQVNFTGSGDHYAVWGHNGEGMTDTWPVSYWNAPLENPIQERSSKIWKFFTNADPGTLKAQIEIDYSASANADFIEPNEDQYLRLLIHTNPLPGDFSQLDTILLPEAAAIDGNTVIFRDVPISNGMYLTLGNTSSITNLPLPIQLIDFTAQLIRQEVELRWQTLSEFNNDFFVAERSIDGINWQSVAIVDGAGNSNQKREYSAKDYLPLKGLSYYRLKQVDFDGNHTHSEPVAVQNTSMVSKREINVFPNPTHFGEVQIQLPESALNQNTVVSLYDFTGKKIFATEFTPSSTIVSQKLNSVTPGIYALNIRVSELLNETVKLIVK
jgi:hypothetical protein